MNSKTTIDRCACSGMSFTEIREQADRMGIRTVKGLKHRLPMGAYCSACAPYVQDMLKTGRVEFDADPDERPDY